MDPFEIDSTRTKIRSPSERNHTVKELFLFVIMEEENNPNIDQNQIIEEEDQEPAGPTIGPLIMTPPPDVIIDETNITNRADEYVVRILNLTGTTLNPPLINVYAGRYPSLEDSFLRDDQYEFFFVKFIDINDQPSQYELFKDQVTKNEQIGPHANLLGIARRFTSDLEKTLYSVLFPFMNLGSLRTVLRAIHPYGFPEVLILFALKETLRGLSVIHRAGEVHKEINAGHIFLNKLGELKLAFSASVFELQPDDEESSSSSSFYPRNTICDWACAPEVHASQGQVYTEKSDVWLIGITALEIAYGGIRVNSREELLSIVESITRKKRLPKKVENEYLQVKPKIKKKKVDALVDRAKKVFSKEEGEGVFSKKLGKVVAKCLAMDPQKRPTVDQLLLKKIFVDSITKIRIRLLDHQSVVPVESS